MSNFSDGFNIYLPESANETQPGLREETAVRKFTARLAPGQTRYEIEHRLGTEDVVVQTRIAGRVREGGVSILDENTVCVMFGGTLNEPMDVVIIG